MKTAEEIIDDWLKLFWDGEIDDRAAMLGAMEEYRAQFKEESDVYWLTPKISEQQLSLFRQHKQQP